MGFQFNRPEDPGYVDLDEEPCQFKFSQNCECWEVEQPLRDRLVWCARCRRREEYLRREELNGRQSIDD